MIESFNIDIIIDYALTDHGYCKYKIETEKSYGGFPTCIIPNDKGIRQKVYESEEFENPEKMKQHAYRKLDEIKEIIKGIKENHEELKKFKQQRFEF